MNNCNKNRQRLDSLSRDINFMQDLEENTNFVVTKPRRKTAQPLKRAKQYSSRGMSAAAAGNASKNKYYRERELDSVPSAKMV